MTFTPAVCGRIRADPSSSRGAGVNPRPSASPLICPATFLFRLVFFVFPFSYLFLHFIGFLVAVPFSLLPRRNRVSLLGFGHIFVSSNSMTN